MCSSVSVDGFVADDNDQPGPLFDMTDGWDGKPPSGIDHVGDRIVERRTGLSGRLATGSRARRPPARPPQPCVPAAWRQPPR